MAALEDVSFHVFGHIHEGFGVTKNKRIDGVTFVNASTVNLQYRVRAPQSPNKPIVFYVKGRGRAHCDVEAVDSAKDEDEVENEQKEEAEVEDAAQSAETKKVDDASAKPDETM